MSRARTVVDTSKTGRVPRELMLGIVVNGASRAYPLARVLEQKLIQDTVGGTQVILVVGPDGKSVRAFAAQLPGASVVPDYYRDPTGLFLDSETGNKWDFQGCAKGTCLQAISILKDYWFDWHLYHPDTTVYSR